jgi:hypothetical protein
MGRQLTEVERSTLSAAVYRVLPSTDGPGAREANVVPFIEWLTQQPCFDRRWDCLVMGLQLLELTAQSRYGQSFHECRANTQDDLITGLATIPHTTIRWFFATLVRLVVTGYLCPPGYSGNRGEVGWRHMGFVTGSPTR